MAKAEINMGIKTTERVDVRDGHCHPQGSGDKKVAQNAYPPPGASNLNHITWS